ncbi:hypothetical protein Tco_1577376 [Tanacetum coccineum]
MEGKEKRVGIEMIQENAKKHKVEDDKEIAELKQCLDIIPDEEEVTIDDIPLAVKSLTLGWLLEEIHVTWAHLEKKRTRLRLYTKSLKETIIQMVETASPTIATTLEIDQDGVKNITMASECSRLK